MKKFMFITYGANSINRGDIRGFMELNNVDTIEELDEALSNRR